MGVKSSLHTHGWTVHTHTQVHETRLFHMTPNYPFASRSQDKDLIYFFSPRQPGKRSSRAALHEMDNPSLWLTLASYAKPCFGCTLLLLLQLREPT